MAKKSKKKAKNTDKGTYMLRPPTIQDIEIKRAIIESSNPVSNDKQIFEIENTTLYELRRAGLL